MPALGATRRNFFADWLSEFRVESPRSAYVTVSRRAMACSFSLMFPGEDRAAIESGCTALEEVDRIEQRLTVFDEDSEVAWLNRSASDGPAAVSRSLYAFLEMAWKLADETGGAFDFTCGALIQAWGFFRGPKRVPADGEREAARQSSGYRNVELRNGTVRYLVPGLGINLGAIGKGYAIDRALAGLECRAVLMQGGGSSTKAIGTPAGEPRGWRVDVGSKISVWLKNQALGTSGADQQYFVAGGKRYGHILDARTGWPANRVRAASAIARSAAEADALSTAFFVMGEEETRSYCKRHNEVGAIVTTLDGRIVVAGDCDVEVRQ